MIFAFDAKRAFHNRSGLGNYSRQLIETVRVAYPEWRIILYSGGKRWDLIPKEWTSDPSIHMVHAKGAYFRSLGILGDLNFRRVQVYHGLSNELPLNIGRFSGKKIVTIHDVIFKHRPGDYSVIDRNIYHLKTAKAVDNADEIIAISDRTARDLEKFYPASKGKISVIYQDADPIFRTDPAPEFVEEVKMKYRLPDRFWLFVGASMPRKNFPALLSAWEAMPQEKRLPIVVTGPETSSYGKKIRQAIDSAGGRDAGLYWLGEVDQFELHGLYHLADMLLFPSEIEGFGLPVLESLYCGTPVLLSRQLGFDQLHGRGVLPVDVSSPRGILDGLLHLENAGPPVPADELHGVYGAKRNLDALLKLYLSRQS